MSNRPDTPDEYQRGSTPVSRAYRALPDGGPPPALDKAILTKARAAVSEQPASELQQRRWRKFAVPVALAASVVMVVGVVLEVNKQSLPTQSLEQQSASENRVPEASNAPATVTTAPRNNAMIAAPEAAVQIAPPPAAPAPREADASQQGLERMAASVDLQLEEMVVTGTAVSPRVSNSPASAERETSENDLAEAVVESRRQTSRFDAVADSAAMAKAAGAAPAEAKSELAEQVQHDPAQWLAAIQALRKAGNTQVADREWLAFRKAWPNYPVPADASSQSSQSK